MRDHAVTLNDLPVDSIGTDDVLAVLQPIWNEIPETASRVRGRIERVLDAAKARGLRPRDAANPAQLRGHLALLLPKQSKLSRGHHAALAYAEIPTFMSALRARPALAARCLEFLILTAARSGEALGATWAEVDLDKAIWTVPAERMKAGKAHEVPLSPRAMELLEGLKTECSKPNELIFVVDGAARSNMAMGMLLRRMGYTEDNKITTHGFRSTFKQWARSRGYPDDLSEEALAHSIGSEARRAYARGEIGELRRPMMEAWSDYLAG